MQQGAINLHGRSAKSNFTQALRRTLLTCLTLAVLNHATPVAAKSRAAITQDCDRKVLLKTERNLDKLKSKDIENFLMTFASNCSHHDDFHDLGNQLLFRVLQRKPAVFIQHLATIPNGKRRAILIELESPLHSDVGIQLLIAKVEKLKGHDRIRDDVVYALKQAELKI